MNRKILTISLLPYTWKDKQYKALHNDLVEGLGQIPELAISSERDIHNLFPKDSLTYGCDGSEVVAQMRVPMHRPSNGLRKQIEEKIEEVLNKHLPNLRNPAIVIDMPPEER